MPVEALSKIFRAIFVQMVRGQLPQVRLPESLWQKNWVVSVSCSVLPTLSLGTCHSDILFFYSRCCPGVALIYAVGPTTAYS